MPSLQPLSTGAFGCYLPNEAKISTQNRKYDMQGLWAPSHCSAGYDVPRLAGNCSKMTEDGQVVAGRFVWGVLSIV